MGVVKRNGVYYIDYYYCGRRIREAVCRNKKTADRALAKKKTEIAENRFLDKRRSHRTRFDQIADQYIEYAKVNKRSWKTDEYRIRSLKKVFGDKLFSHITSADVEDYKRQRVTQVKPSTVNRELACLKYMFTKAVEWQLADANPARSVKLLKEDNGRLRYLKQEEVLCLMSECKGVLRPIVILALNTGMRRGEILGLEWTEVDLRQRIITVRNSKNGDARFIPMNSDVYETLRRIPRTGEHVFCRENGKPVSCIRESFKAAMKRAGIKNFRFHDLRHTFASHMAMNGADMLAIKELMGHKTWSMTLRYAHLSDSYKGNAIKHLKYSDSHKSVTPSSTKEYAGS